MSSINHRRFELKKEHLALISALKYDAISMSILFNEYNETLTPFGGIDLVTDLGDILIGRELSDEDKLRLTDLGGDFKSRDNDMGWAMDFYREIPVALEVISNRRTFELGLFRTRWYETDWKKIKKNE